MMSIPLTPKDRLSDWLNYLAGIHSSAIDMGLERVMPVFEYLNIQKNAFIFTVAGTNGKGSITATISHLCRQTGLKTALYQSPHLVSFNERIRIDGEEVDDERLVWAFYQVEQARQACQLSLSFFEMTTLAALLIFSQSACDVWVLEVGLGGRLDVVNVIDPDVCVISNVAIDHIDWLGDTREKIGYEKAGILRDKAVLVYGETDMPNSVKKAIKEKGVQCYQYGIDYAYQAYDDGWVYSTASLTYRLSKPSLALMNVSSAITALLASPFASHFSQDLIDKALLTLRLAGRFDRRQIMARQWLFDVAHNEAGVQFLLNQFKKTWEDYSDNFASARLFLVFSMLADKDSDEVLSLFAKSGLPVSAIVSAPLDSPRTLDKQALAQKLNTHLPQVATEICETIDDAIDKVLALSAPEDFVLVFGSFHTIGESLVALGQYQGYKPI